MASQPKGHLAVSRNHFQTPLGDQHSVQGSRWPGHQVHPHSSYMASIYWSPSVLLLGKQDKQRPPLLSRGSHHQVRGVEMGAVRNSHEEM